MSDLNYLSIDLKPQQPVQSEAAIKLFKGLAESLTKGKDLSIPPSQFVIAYGLNPKTTT